MEATATTETAATTTTSMKTMLRSTNGNNNNDQQRFLSVDGGMHCGCMECDYDAWHTLAADDISGEHTCGSRIEFLMFTGLLGEEEACLQVSNVEFPTQCGKCNPVSCTKRPTPRCGCPSCNDVWDDIADSHSCGSRITFLQTSKLLEQTLTEEEACIKVGRDE